MLSATGVLAGGESPPTAPEAVSGTAGGIVAAATGTASESVKPQARQNRLPGVSGSLHDGQPTRGAPQSPQNLSPPEADAPHWAHAIITQVYSLGKIPVERIRA